MAFHKQNTHGRVFHGLEARHMLEAEKRDSHGSKIKLNLPDNKLNFIHNFVGANVDTIGVNNKDAFIHNAGKKEGATVTVTSKVYFTESKTFPGPAVYVTKTGHSPPPAPAATTSVVSPPVSAAAAPSTNSTPSSQPQQTPSQNSYESAKSRQHLGHTKASSAAASSSVNNNGVIGGTPLSHSRGPTALKGTPLAASHSITANQISNTSHGMTSGGKAGLALGILAIIGIVAGLALFCIRRRKNQLAENGERLDEKHASQNSFFSGTAAAMDAPAGNKRTSGSSFTNRTGATAPRLSLRPVAALLPNAMTGNQMSEKPRENPFGDGAMVSEKQSSQSNPFADGRPSTPNHSSRPSWEGSDAGTPKGAQVGTAAAVAVGGAKGPAPPRGPNNVHRVQLDFKPSMDDELELKSGQLVRMLHEYDDGWALCIRMDRSQQGVCPRTCLSKLPVKPRPNGPPPNGPNGRPMGPPPPGMRGPPPPGGNKMMPRPLTPNGRERSNTASDRTSVPSPQEEARVRSQSVSAADRPVSPIDSGIPARKPVGSPAV